MWGTRAKKVARDDTGAKQEQSQNPDQINDNQQKSELSTKFSNGKFWHI